MSYLYIGLTDTRDVLPERRGLADRATKLASIELGIRQPAVVWFLPLDVWQEFRAKMQGDPGEVWEDHRDLYALTMRSRPGTIALRADLDLELTVKAAAHESVHVAQLAQDNWFDEEYGDWEQEALAYVPPFLKRHRRVLGPLSEQTDEAS